MPPNPQPVLPAEGAYTDIEHLFIEEQPKNLWPVNQNSNLGAIRKVISDLLQGGLITLDELALERFVMSSLATGYLGRWEAEVGLPVAPTSVSEASRRALVIGRLQKGAYTRQRRREIVEAHITATFGQPLELTPAGIPIPVGGLPLFSEGGVVTELYRIYEDTKNFSFEIRIDTDVDPNFISLDREIRAATPAWLAFTIAEYANVLDYNKMVMDSAPVGYWRLGADFNDYSGHGRNLTKAGPDVWTSVASLINSAVAGGNQASQRPADVMNWYAHSSFNQWLTASKTWTIETWVDIPAMSAGHILQPVVSDEWIGNGYVMHISYNGASQPQSLYATVGMGGAQVATTPIGLATGIRHIVMRRTSDRLQVFVDGAYATQSSISLPDTAGNGTASGIKIGAGQNVYKQDDTVAYNYPLSDAKILEHFRTGKNIP